MARNYNRRTEKDYGFLRSLFYQLFVVLVVTPVVKLMYKLKVEGRENVPNTSRVIYAGNHVSYLVNKEGYLNYEFHSPLDIFGKTYSFIRFND